MGRGFNRRGRTGPARRCALAVLGCLAAAGLAAPAAAQDATPAVAQAAIVQPLSLAKTADLDFGQVAVNTAGTVIMTATATPTCTVTGGVIQYGICKPAAFEGYGQTGRTVRIKVPGAGGITLTAPGGATMKITGVTTTSGGSLGPPLTGNASSNGFRRYRIASADGSFEFRLAGTLNVAAGQAFGVYSATVAIDIAYE